MKINLNIKKLQNFFNNNSIIVVGIAATTITAVMSYGIFSEINKDEKISNELSNVHYLTDNKREIPLSNLYYVEKNNQKYICTREIIDIDIMPIIPIIHRNIYKYVDIKTNEIICTDKDENVKVSNISNDLKSDIKDNEININDINQEYIEEKILIKSK